MQVDYNITYPVLQVRGRSLIQYNEYAFERSGRTKLKLQQHLKEVRENSPAYSGIMTVGAKKRLSKAVSLLVQSSKPRIIFNPVSQTYHQFKLSFLTLTIPLNHIRPEAKFCNKFLLEPMIRILRNRYGLKSYIWKLELQQNGMVHYHLTCNMFINHSSLKDEWNNILSRNGLLDEYRERSGNLWPNSTDIKSVKQIRDFEAYLIKYVSKDGQNQEGVKTKIWDCSLNLKSAEFYVINASWSYLERLESLEKSGSISVYAGERYIMYKFKTIDIKSFLDKEDLKFYNLHLTNIRNGKIIKQEDQYTSLRDSTTEDNIRRENDTAKRMGSGQGKGYIHDEITKRLEKERKAAIPVYVNTSFCYKYQQDEKGIVRYL